MNADEIKQIIDELEDCVQLGPGDNKPTLCRVNELLSRLQSDIRSDAYVKEKVVSVRESFKVWFSPRGWNRTGDGGIQAQSNLLADINRLTDACDTAFGSNERDA